MFDRISWRWPTEYSIHARRNRDHAADSRPALLSAVARTLTFCALTLTLTLVCTIAAKAQTVYTGLAGDPAAYNHYPGPNGLVGDSDDIISGDVTSIMGSDPNYLASYSLAAGKSPAAAVDPAIPTGFDTIAFIQGTMTTDDAVAAGGGGSLFQALDIMITQPVQGAPQPGGATGVTLAVVNGGAYDPVTGAITTDLGIQITIPVFPIPVPVTAMAAAGTAFVVAAADFGAGAPTGNPYVDSVLVPKAAALNASSLLFVDMQGTEPVTGIAYRWVFAGVAGVPVAGQADLALTKTSSPGGPVTPGAEMDFILTADNSGLADASGVVVVDRLPQAALWQSDDCGAGPPDGGGTLTWNLGVLPAAAGPALCTVTVQITGNTVFDQMNGAAIYGLEADPDLANNIAKLQVTVQASALNGLLQATDLTPPTLLPSDADCDNCIGGDQAIADNFHVFADGVLNRVRFFGFYFDPASGATTAFPDQLTVQIHAAEQTSVAPDVNGVPGTLLATLDGAVNRELTGNTISGIPEYRYTIDTSLNLPRGEYWLVIINDSSAAGGALDWFWALGDPDTENRTIVGIAGSTTVPPAGFWSPNPGFEMAFELGGAGLGAPVEVPAFDLSGLLLLVLLLGAAALLRLRRRSGGRTA